jgi:ABC-2 type transport system permease protein
MNAGKYTFVIDIPPNFARDLLAGRPPTIELDVDTTVMTQAGDRVRLRARDHK